MTVDRTHPDLSSIRPVVDVGKAKATLVDCTTELCTGTCTAEFLQELKLEVSQHPCPTPNGVHSEYILPSLSESDPPHTTTTTTHNQSAWCGPHGGICANLTKPEQHQVRRDHVWRVLRVHPALSSVCPLCSTPSPAGTTGGLPLRG